MVARKNTKKEDLLNRKIPCMVYSRVVGYYRPTSSYNKGKEQEWSERKLISREMK